MPIIKVGEIPPIYGMNNVDDPRVLRPGECVSLVNLIPGNPPQVRNGCLGHLLGGTGAYDIIPPGRTIKFNNTIYAVFWIYDNDNLVYKPIMYEVGSSSYNVLGSATLSTNDEPILFGVEQYCGCIYTTVSDAMAGWEVEGTTPGAELYAIGNKVIESSTVIRDMCITADIITPTVTFERGISGFIGTGAYYQYAFQYVRRNDTAAFEAGTPPAGLILPPNITAGYAPKFIDTYLPGACIGVEYVDDRVVHHNVTGVSLPVLSYATVTHSGLNNYNEAELFDGDTVNKAFDVDELSAGEYLKFDFEENEVAIQTIQLYWGGASSDANYSFQYSDDDSEWSDGVTDVVFGTTVYDVDCLGIAHRYYRLYLTNSPTGDEDGITEVVLSEYGKATINIGQWFDHDIALAQGATHVRVSRSLGATTAALAQAATKYYLCDIPIGEDEVVDELNDTALAGEQNQLITGYTEAPPAAFICSANGRTFAFAKNGIVYYSESIGGDGGTNLAIANAYPQAWGSLYDINNYILECDTEDGQQCTGLVYDGNNLYAFKEKKIFMLIGADPSKYSMRRISDTIGCAFPYTITYNDNFNGFGRGVLFLSNEGPMFLGSTGQLTAVPFKIKEFNPSNAYENVLYDSLETDYNWIIRNCSGAYAKKTWFIMYTLANGTHKAYGLYLNNVPLGEGVPNGAYEIRLAGL